MIDTETKEVVETITVPEQRQGVGDINYVTDVAVSPNTNGSVIYALRFYHDSSGSYGSITKIDTQTGAITTTLTPWVSDLNITPDGTRILAAPGRYAAMLGQATDIKVYDATTLAEVGTIDFTRLGPGSYVLGSLLAALARTR